jgi:hypothetical protein
MKKQTTKNKNLAAHHGGGPDSQGGAQQGTGARGEQYLDGRARSHTIVRRVLFGTSKPYAPKYIINQLQNALTDCPFFRSKRMMSVVPTGAVSNPNNKLPAGGQ